MSSFGARVSPVELPPERLPEYLAHHDAKHKLLRKYAQVWLPKLGYSYPQVAIVDCFASAGRYRDGSPGSPLVLLSAYCDWDWPRPLRSPPRFIFLEQRKEFAQHLQFEVNRIPDLRGAHVEVRHGRYEDAFPEVVASLSSRYRQRLPTFAFVDPKGWRDNPFHLIARYREQLGPKAEALIYLPASFMARFAEQDFVKASLTRTFGDLSFEEAVAAKDDRAALSAAERLAEAYRQKLKGDHFDWVTRFRINPVRKNGYYLLFGTASMDGLREMKRAMWTVDPIGGRAYEQDALAAVGHSQLFAPASFDVLPSEEGLISLLKEHFGRERFSIEEAEEFTLTQTRYLDRPHLRNWALKPLQDADQLEVLGDGAARRGQFPPGTQLRII